MLRRPRRLRSTKAIRNLVRETKLQKEEFNLSFIYSRWVKI